MSPQGEISGVPVSHRDNSGVYSTVQQITELRQTVGCVYQYQRHSPRLHINASLTLHLYMACFGDWPTHFSSFLSSPFSPLNLISSLILPSSFFFLSFLSLPLLLPPAFSFSFSFPHSSSFRCVPTVYQSSCLCVCLSGLSL